MSDHQYLVRSESGYSDHTFLTYDEAVAWASSRVEDTESNNYRNYFVYKLAGTVKPKSVVAEVTKN